MRGGSASRWCPQQSECKSVHVNAFQYVGDDYGLYCLSNFMQIKRFFCMNLGSQPHNYYITLSDVRNDLVRIYLTGTSQPAGAASCRLSRRSCGRRGSRRCRPALPRLIKTSPTTITSRLAHTISRCFSKSHDSCLAFQDS